MWRNKATLPADRNFLSLTLSFQIDPRLSTSQLARKGKDMAGHRGGLHAYAWLPLISHCSKVNHIVRTTLALEEARSLPRAQSPCDTSERTINPGKGVVERKAFPLCSHWRLTLPGRAHTLLAHRCWRQVLLTMVWAESKKGLRKSQVGRRGTTMAQAQTWVSSLSSGHKRTLAQDLLRVSTSNPWAEMYHVGV